MNNVVVDTNFLVSQLDVQDKWNSTTDKIISSLENYELMFLDIVINETINVIQKRYESKNKLDEFIKFIDNIYHTFTKDQIFWLSSEISDYHFRVLDTIKFYKGVLNYNDCLIINYMREKGIKHILSYDMDFDLCKDIKRIYK